ncbi:MAG: phosphoribosylglycinamide formyltransferase [Chitinophagales bacterium]
MTHSKKRIAIFISGRGSNMKAIAEQAQNGILKNCCEIVLVFSNKAAAKGLQTASEMGIKTAFIGSKGKKRQTFDQQVIDFVETFNLDYIVLAGYMRILSPLFTRYFAKKIINIHPADTRLHQGLHAYEWAFDTKRKQTCITVHFVNEGVDTGEIIAQQTVDLNDVQSLEEVEIRGLKTEHWFYSEVLRDLFEQN